MPRKKTAGETDDEEKKTSAAGTKPKRGRPKKVVAPEEAKEAALEKTPEAAKETTLEKTPEAAKEAVPEKAPEEAKTSTRPREVESAKAEEPKKAAEKLAPEKRAPGKKKEEAAPEKKEVVAEVKVEEARAALKEAMPEVPPPVIKEVKPVEEMKIEPAKEEPKAPEKPVHVEVPKPEVKAPEKPVHIEKPKVEVKAPEKPVHIEMSKVEAKAHEKPVHVEKPKVEVKIPEKPARAEKPKEKPKEVKAAPPSEAAPKEIPRKAPKKIVPSVRYDAKLEEFLNKRKEEKKRVEVNVYSLEGEAVRKVALPDVFHSELRRDVIKRAVDSFRSNRRQPYAPAPTAGMRHSVEQWGKGRGVARMMRVKGEFKGAQAPMAVGGRRAHPPKVEKSYSKKINRKERRMARYSALAATASRDLVAARGHLANPKLTYPVILEDKFEGLDTTREIIATLDKLKLYDDVLRAREGTHIRAGRGKMRGRVYRTPRSALFVLSKPDAAKGLRNLPGVDMAVPANLNAEDLAPGGLPGRLTIFTESAFEALRKWSQ